MANFNKVILAGNLTRDPELRYMPNGKAVARIGMAINRNWTTETGEKRVDVTFVDVEAFARQAEVIAQGRAPCCRNGAAVRIAPSPAGPD